MSQVPYRSKVVNRRPHWRRVLTWAGRGLLALIVLSALLLVAADLFRQQRMRTATARLNAAIAQVDDEILKGQTPAEWHTARIEGENGWPHIAVIRDYGEATAKWNMESWGEDDPGPEPDLVRIGRALEELSDYFNDNWTSSEVDGPDTPTPEQIAEWMAITDPVAQGFARAAECDVVVVLPKEGEFYPYSVGMPLTDVIGACRAMLARCRIHLDEGRDEQARRELTSYLTTWSKASQPLFVLGYMVDFGNFRAGLEFALEQFEARSVPLGIADDIAALKFDPIAGLERAVEAEVVWLAANAREADWALAEPRWFGWIRGGIPPGKGLFEDDFSSMEDAFLGPANMCMNIAITLESDIALARYVRGSHAWDPKHLPEVAYSPIALTPSKLFKLRNYLTRGSVHMLCLELRHLERKQGPLVENKDFVGRLVAGYPGVVNDWDGDDLLLKLSPRWERDLSLAYAAESEDGSQINELVKSIAEDRASDDDPDWPLRLAPLGD